MAKMIAAGLIVAVLLVLPGGDGWAQDSALRQGATVRVAWSPPSAARSVGTATEIRPASFLFMPASGDSSQQVHFSGLKALDVSTGRKGHSVHGFLLGLVGGAALGYFLTSNNIGGDIDQRPVGALVFGVGGGLLGAVIGSHVKTDRWATVVIR